MTKTALERLASQMDRPSGDAPLIDKVLWSMDCGLVGGRLESEIEGWLESHSDRDWLEMMSMLIHLGRNAQGAPRTDKMSAAYREYKNAKKWLRKRVADGVITKEERAVRQRKAYSKYRERLESGWVGDTERSRRVIEDGIAGRAYALDNDVPGVVIGGGNEVCNELCLGARQPYCDCPCDGKNHGVARGRHPMEVIVGSGKGLTQEIRVGRGDIPLESYVERKGHGWNIERFGIPKGWTEQEIRDAGLAYKHASKSGREAAVKAGRGKAKDYNKR